MAGAGGSEQKELLALMHQHLVQIGYERAARELLAQSGQKTFLPHPVPLGDIFTQWKKTSAQAQKRKAEEIKQGSPAKIRVPDPKSSSESSEDEASKPIKSNVAVNNSSLAEAESSSEDEDSSSEEEEAAGKEVKVPTAGNKSSNLLQLAAQKTNAFPGKGVAVAAVQAKGQQKKATATPKAESSSDDDSDSEEETLQVKRTVEGRQVDTTVTKRVPATAVPSKGNAVKASPAKKTAPQTRAGSGNVAKTTKPADSSETSDSSDTEIEEPSLAAQAKPPEKPPQTFSSPVKNAAAPKSTKAASSPALFKQTPKTPAVKQPPPAKTASGVKKAESSESSESSSESEDEAPSVPVIQKKLQTPQHPTGARQNQIVKPGSPAKAVSSALKGKEAESESSSSSSDSEDEMIPPTQDNLPSPFATKANAAPQVLSAAKSLPPPGGPIQKAQESEDSSLDSSNESDSEEDKVFTQKPAQETQKPTPAPGKAPAAKIAGATPGKAGNAQPAGKVWTASPMKSAAASLQKAANDSSDSSQDEVAAAKPGKQVPIHPFFLPKAVKTATPPGKHAQASSSTPNSVSTKCQGPAAVTTGKVAQSSSKKPRLSQAPSDKPDGKDKESSGSSSSSDSEAEALTTTKQIPQPASIPQKQGVMGKPKSSSEATSSDEDQEAPQSLFKGPIKTPQPTLPKAAAPALSKQSSRKATSALPSPPVSMAFGESSSSDDSDSDTLTKEIVGKKTEIGPLSSSGKEAARTKGAAARKKAGSVGSKVGSTKKAAAKAQSNGSTKKNPSGQLPLPLLASTKTAQVGSGEAAAQVPGAAAQGEPQATPVVAVKPPKATKAGAKEKRPKKRKLAAGDAGLGEPKEKKLKAKKKLKKEKVKASDSSEKPKKKGSKERKADKKKKKSKKPESLSTDGSQKKKKKKKKTGDLEGAA